MAHEACYILGSGRSILDLSPDERAYLQEHPYTLAMNKYMLFHELAGIVPADFFLADRQFPAQHVFLESVRISRGLVEPPHFYVNDYYRRLKPRWTKFKNLRFNFKERRKHWKQFGYRIPWRLEYPPEISYFRSGLKSNRPFFWAESLNEELYFYRGSLTTAINLAYLIYPAKRICLIGVDLNQAGSFYQEAIAEMPIFHERIDPRIKERDDHGKAVDTHSTALDYKGVPGVQAVLPTVVDALRERGRELVCANPRSLLVEEGICEHGPILACDRPA